MTVVNNNNTELHRINDMQQRHFTSNSIDFYQTLFRASTLLSNNMMSLNKEAYTHANTQQQVGVP